VVTNRYLPGVTQPLVPFLLALMGIAGGLVALDRLIAEGRHFTSSLAVALNAAAERTSQEIEELRKEIRRQSEQPGAKAAGFQVAPDDNG